MIDATTTGREIAGLVTRLADRAHAAQDDDLAKAAALIHTLMMETRHMVAINERVCDLLHDALTLLRIFAPGEAKVSLYGITGTDDITIGQFITGVQSTIDDIAPRTVAPGPTGVQ